MSLKTSLNKLLNFRGNFPKRHLCLIIYDFRWNFRSLLNNEIRKSFSRLTIDVNRSISTFFCLSWFYPPNRKFNKQKKRSSKMYFSITNGNNAFFLHILRLSSQRGLRVGSLRVLNQVALSLYLKYKQHSSSLTVFSCVHFAVYNVVFQYIFFLSSSRLCWQNNKKKKLKSQCFHHSVGVVECAYGEFCS